MVALASDFRLRSIRVSMRPLSWVMAPAARERVEIGGVEDVAPVGLVEHGDRAVVVHGQHVQDDASHRRDAGVAGEEDDRLRIVLRQEEVAVRTVDRHSAPVFRFLSAAPPRPGPTRTQSWIACGRSGAEAMV